MNTCKKGKKLIVCLIFLMCVTLISFSAVYIFNKPNEETETAAATYYHINDEWDLINFSSAMWYDDNADVVASLNADLDMSGFCFIPIGMHCNLDYNQEYIDDFYGCTPFWGEFKGNGHTIKNLTINYNADYTVLWNTNGTYTGNALGLFGYLGGEVSGVRLENMRINANPTAYYHKQSPYGWLYEDCWMGGIAGVTFKTATVTGCVVENLVVVDENADKGSTCAGLVGNMWWNGYETTSLYVQNCLVNDITVSGVESANIASLVYDYGTTTKVNDCLVRNVDYNFFGSDETSISSCYNNLAKARTGLNDIYGWYVPPTTEFNDGWPHPNNEYFYEFIKFDYYVLDSNGDVDPNNFADDYEKYEIEIEIPYFYRYYSCNYEEEIIKPNLILNSEDGTFFGTSVTISAPQGLKFSQWKFLGEDFYYHYQAQFKSTKIKVNFESVSVGGTTLRPSVTSYEVLPNSTLNIAYNYNNKRVEIKVSTTVIAYYNLSSSAMKRYYCKSTTQKLGTQDVTFKPTIILKTYGVQVG